MHDQALIDQHEEEDYAVLCWTIDKIEELDQKLRVRGPYGMFNDPT